MSLYLIIILSLTIVAFLANLFLAMLVLLKNFRGGVNRTYAIFAFSLALWNLLAFLMATMPVSWHLFLGRQTFFWGTIMAGAFLYFALIFPNKKMPFWLTAAWTLLVGLVAFLQMTPLTTIGVVVKENFIVGEFGPMMVPTALWGLLVFGLGIGILIRNFFVLKGIYRSQLAHAITGFFLFSASFLTTNVILQIIFKDPRFNYLGPISSLPMIAMIGYAIIRYRLMDISLIIRRGLIFSTLFSVLIFIFIFLTTFFSRYNLSLIWSDIISALIITLLFIPFRTVLENLTDRIFFKKRYNFELIVGEFGRILARYSKLEELLHKVLEHLHKTLKVKKAAILLLDQQSKFVTKAFIGEGKQPLLVAAESHLVRQAGNLVSDVAANHVNQQTLIIERDELKYRLSDTKTPESLKSWLRGVLAEFDDLSFSAAVPLFIKGKLFGLLLVGEKISDDPFFSQDIRLLETISHEASFSIENAMNFERLMELDRAKSAFISVVSHQFRTPLSVIRWNTEIVMEKGVERKRRKESLDNIYASVNFLIRQLNDTLAVLDIENKKLELRSESCYPQEIISGLIKFNQPLIQSKKLKIKMSVDDRVKEISGDSEKIRRMMDVILLNALTYASPVGGLVEIVMKEKFLDSQRLLEILISDNGMGITKEEQRHIFKKFFRGKEAIKISPNGLGLGLFIVESFIDFYGGEISFESAGRNQGTKFRILLPI